ncbi:MAG: fibronectin type III domain-containing protein, partial [bacterium]
STQIKITWTDNSNNETGFKIERKLSSAVTYTQIATVGANLTSYSNAGLKPNTAYSYRVFAYNAGGNSGYSNVANAKTLPSPPAAPSALAATVMSSNRIDLSWQDNANDELIFIIERKTGLLGTYAEIVKVNANVTSYSNTGLSPNTKYFYRVRAYKNVGGNSGYSNEASATTKPTLPAKPGNLIATVAGSGQIKLAWTDNSANETGFKIERKTGAAGTYTQIATAGANETSFANMGLNPNTAYFYRVRAYNAGGQSAYSNEVNAKTLPSSPKAPGSLTAASVSISQIDLAWADNSANETGFKIERKAEADGAYAEIATAGANATSFADTSLTANTQYFYRVRAYNTGGHSAYSNDANATTLPNPPEAPSSLAATALSGVQINLAWADDSNDEDGFKIERKTGAAGAYAEIATVGASVTSYSNTGLNPSTEYFYRVCAYNAGGNSAYSNEAGAITFSNDANLALDKPVHASSTDSTSSPSRAVDDNGQTYWRSSFVNATNPIVWLRVELSPSSTVMIDRAVVKWNQNYFAKEYEFQVSTDGTSWETVYTNDAGAVGAQDFTFAPVMARFVRLYMKKHEKSNYRVIELEVYAGSGTAKSTSRDGSQDRVIIPETVTLAQNYPNPFSANGTTTISYALPEGMHVTLKIINIAGQEVATLANGHRGRGIYHATFNASNLPSGVYFSVLKAGETTQVRRMVLAK